MSYCASVVALAALAARAFARFATSAAFRAGDNFFFATALFAVAFLATTGFVFALWNAAHRFLVASEMAFRPAALILRFGFAVTVLDGSSASPFDAAHLLRWASAIAFLPAALILRRLGFVGSGVDGVGLVEPPSNMARSSVIWVSIRSFCWPVVPPGHPH